MNRIMNNVECTSCTWQGSEDDLLSINESGSCHLYKRCPNCKGSDFSKVELTGNVDIEITI